jgi:outer membrane protein assembly factor BamE (lipoprotein component of BamABCDE complex)
MNKLLVSIVCLMLCAGCAEMCTFGRSDGSSGLQCRRVDAKVEIGMTAQEVQSKVGQPSRRNIDVFYRGKTYDEAWIYETSPVMILYFKSGVLEAKDYQQ